MKDLERESQTCGLEKKGKQSALQIQLLQHALQVKQQKSSSSSDCLPRLLQASLYILQAGPPATAGKQQPHVPAEATQGQGNGHLAKPSAAKAKQQAAVGKDSEVHSEQRVPQAGRSKPATLPPAPPTSVKPPESRQPAFGPFGVRPLQAGLRSLSDRLKGALAGGLLNDCSVVVCVVHVGVSGEGPVGLGGVPMQQAPDWCRRHPVQERHRAGWPQEGNGHTRVLPGRVTSLVLLRLAEAVPADPGVLSLPNI